MSCRQQSYLAQVSGFIYLSHWVLVYTVYEGHSFPKSLATGRPRMLNKFGFDNEPTRWGGAQWFSFSSSRDVISWFHPQSHPVNIAIHGAQHSFLTYPISQHNPKAELWPGCSVELPRENGAREVCQTFVRHQNLRFPSGSVDLPSLLGMSPYLLGLTALCWEIPEFALEPACLGSSNGPCRVVENSGLLNHQARGMSQHCKGAPS